MNTIRHFRSARTVGARHTSSSPAVATPAVATVWKVSTRPSEAEEPSPSDQRRPGRPGARVAVLDDPAATADRESASRRPGSAALRVRPAAAGWRYRLPAWAVSTWELWKHLAARSREQISPRCRRYPPAPWTAKWRWPAHARCAARASRPPSTSTRVPPAPAGWPPGGRCWQCRSGPAWPPQARSAAGPDSRRCHPRRGARPPGQAHLPEGSDNINPPRCDRYHGAVTVLPDASYESIRDGVGG